MASLEKEVALRILVASDIHSNSLTLELFFKASEELMPDHVVILGDLFTYGPDPVGVAQQVGTSIKGTNVHLVEGNHDRLYLDLLVGEYSYFEKLPDWIKETVYWTKERMKSNWDDIANWPWKQELKLGPIYFSHANPFGLHNWRYINDNSDVREVFETLSRKGHQVGVFGHNHRAAAFEYCRSNAIFKEILRPNINLILDTDRCSYLNPGSLGQPRDEKKLCTFLDLNYSKDILQVQWKSVSNNSLQYAQDIRKLPLSNEAKENILKFFISDEAIS